MLLISINVSELLISLYGIPVDFVASIQLGWKLGESFCQLTGFLLTFLGKNVKYKGWYYHYNFIYPGLYGINILTCVSLYRWLLVHSYVSIVFDI